MTPAGSTPRPSLIVRLFLGGLLLLLLSWAAFMTYYVLVEARKPIQREPLPGRPAVATNAVNRPRSGHRRAVARRLACGPAPGS